MNAQNIKKILIVGGGTAGWMTAASLAKFHKGSEVEIQLVESEDIPTVGVGEATIPQIQIFNRSLGINEDDFIKFTNGTFKLGIEFVNWGKIGDSYIHAFGELGRNIESLPFHQFWWKLRQAGKADHLGAYCLNTKASQQNRFMRSVNAGNSPLSNIAYAYQFDAGLYAKYLRVYSEKLGVKRLQAEVTEVRLREDGFVDSVFTSDNQKLEADFFVDCTGFRGLIIKGALKTPFEDWSRWLPCDSAWAVPSERLGELHPYTKSIAQASGWQWRIPLQHRTGNGHVFSSKFISDEDAQKTLIDNLETRQLTEPRLLRFTTGKRKKIWDKNCVAIGLSSGFLEPLESTAIHLIQSSISHLLSAFPSKTFRQPVIDEFNRQLDFEYECIRDFLILHYHATSRSDSDFWNYNRTMSIPDTLREKIELFKANGQIKRFNQELFNENSWVEVFHGQGIEPGEYHPLVDNLEINELERRVSHIKKVINSSVDAMPKQEEFIEMYCSAKD